MIEFLWGFVVAALSGLGIGGGGLLVIKLVLLDGVNQLTSQGVNLLFFLVSSGASMLRHLTKRRLNLRLIAFLAALGLPGALIGSILARAVEPELVRSSFGWLLLISGTMALFRS